MVKAATKRNKKEKTFFCLCKKGKGYGTTTALHTHIKLKHKDEEIFKQHYKDVYDDFVRQKNQMSSMLDDMTLDEVDANRHDLIKQRVINAILLAIREAFGRTLTQSLLLDTEKTNQQDYEEYDIRGELCRNDEIVQIRQRELIQKYGLWELFNNKFPHFEEFAYKPTPDQQGKEGKFILMKKEMAQNFSMDWAPKIHLQLDICAAKESEVIGPEMQAKIKSCELRMWGQYVLMATFMKKYYKFYRIALKMYRQ